MSIIKVEHLTKDYGYNRGVFDVSFTVRKGEVFGFLGPNGAGKTTTIRHIMGFSRPQSGKASVNGMNCRKQYHEILRDVGYLPGEIALPEHLTGTQFIKMMAELRGVTDMSYTEKLITKFEFNTTGKLKRMSAGMKRKLAIVTAFMHDPAILVLDEPTSALDPVMQDIFIQFILEEKARGKTILLSSHMFSEVDATCDRISIIKDGWLVSTFVADDLRHNERKEWKIEFADRVEFDRFRREIEQPKKLNVVLADEQRNQVHIVAYDNDVSNLIEGLANYSLNFMAEIKFTLEDYFMKFYDKDTQIEGGSDDAFN